MVAGTGPRPSRRNVMFRILVVAFALCLPLQASWAAMIDGQKCVSMVSKQINPYTQVITYVCRTVDGGVASGPTVELRMRNAGLAASAKKAYQR
jgi:hypothetical protein